MGQAQRLGDKDTEQSEEKGQEGGREQESEV